MKTIALILLAIPLLVSGSKAQDKNITGLLNKEETRTEIFNTILNDHNMMSEFINAMKHNDHAMMMINENLPMSGNSNGMGNGSMMNHSSAMGNSSMMNKSSMMGNESMDEAQTSSSHHMNGMANSNEMMNQMIKTMKENPQMMPQIMGRMMDISESDSTLYKNMVEVMKQHQNMMDTGMQHMKNHNGPQNSMVQHMPHN
jgi:hypothetical protein